MLFFEIASRLTSLLAAHPRTDIHNFNHDTSESLQTRNAEQRLVVSDNVAVLQRTEGRPKSSLALQAHIAAKGNASLKAVAGGNGYAAFVQFGKVQTLLSIDTGSSDTWVAANNFRCIDGYGYQVPQDVCSFGPLYSATFEEGQISDENFNVSYGSGEFVVGTVGYTDLTIAGVEVAHQEAALVNEAYWQGDGETSGLVGLAYEALTSSYHGDDPNQDDPYTNLVQYQPLVLNALANNVFSMFSLAIERGNGSDGSDAGYLALNGLPPVKYNQSFVSTPIMTTVLQQTADQQPVYAYYTIQPDGYVVSGPSGSGNNGRPLPKQNFPVIIDSGTTLNYLPFALASRVNSLFRPAARFSPYLGLWEVDCSATAPTFAVTIAGTNFYIDSQDLILQGEAGYDDSTGRCVTAIQASPSAPYILGDAFLKSVVAAFDVGAGQLRFAARQT